MPTSLADRPGADVVATPGQIDANFFGEGARSPDRGGSTSGEEFFAYGRSSDRRDARARYRYIGVERDEETGLCMTGPRTYDPVVGRFHQGDPLVLAKSPFEYASSAPIRSRDRSGYQPEGTEPESSQPSPVIADNYTSYAIPPSQADVAQMAHGIETTLEAYREADLPTAFMTDALEGVPRVIAGDDAKLATNVLGNPVALNLPTEAGRLVPNLPHESAHYALQTSASPELSGVLEGQAQKLLNEGQSWTRPTANYYSKELIAMYVETKMTGARDRIAYANAELEQYRQTLDYDAFAAGMDILAVGYAAQVDPNSITYQGRKGITEAAAAWADAEVMEGLSSDLYQVPAIRDIMIAAEWIRMGGQ